MPRLPPSRVLLSDLTPVGATLLSHDASEGLVAEQACRVGWCHWMQTELALGWCLESHSGLLCGCF